MSTERSQFPQEESNVQRAVEEGLELLRAELGERADELVSSADAVSSLRIEEYQSRTFQDAGFSYMPEVYGRSDRSLIILTFSDGRQTIVVNGKVSSGNPYEVMHATMGGADLRKKVATVYEFDGDETITEKSPNGDVNTYQGEYGKPGVLLGFTRRELGKFVSGEDFRVIPNTKDDKK